MNEKEFEFLGITKFHQKGYTGKNITIASREQIPAGIFDDVECDNYRSTMNDLGEHALTTMDYIRQVVPDARKISCDLTGTVENDIWISEGMEKLLADPPDIFTSSKPSIQDYKEHHMIKYRELLNKGCFLIHSAGNDGEKGTNRVVADDTFKAISAYRLYKGEPQKESFSGESEAVDFACLDNLKSKWNNRKNKGTSFSAPLFAGMVGLVQDFFIVKTGKKLSNEKLLKFIKDNCVDLEESGRDNKSGYGLFILPDPEKINISRYSDIKKFKDYMEYEKAIDYLAEKNEMDSPDLWKKRINENNDINLMWFCIKWANAVKRNN